MGEKKKKEDLGDDGTPTADPDSPVIVQLQQSVVVKAEATKELHLRAPLGADIRKCGLPFMVQMASNDGLEGDEDDGDLGQVNMNAVCKYIARLGGVPMVQVDKMPAGDIMRCYKKLLPFFRELEEADPTS